MGNRLSRIATHTGDDGSTGLADGSRVAKTSTRVRAMGEVDELNACLGLVLAESLPDAIREDLLTAQHVLFDLGGELSLPGQAVLAEADIDRLDARLSACNETLPPLKEFVLPGGGRAAACCHLARTVCRRAERALLSLYQEEDDNHLNPVTPVYLNRLSDLLFVVARVLARQEGGAEVTWDRSRRG